MESTAPKIASKIIGLVLPIFKSEAFSNIKDELKDAFKNEILIQWSKIKKIFIQEIKDSNTLEMLEKYPSDEKAKLKAETKLETLLEMKPELAKEFEQWLNSTHNTYFDLINKIGIVEGNKNELYQGTGKEGTTQKTLNEIEKVKGDGNKIWQNINTPPQNK